MAPLPGAATSIQTVEKVQRSLVVEVFRRRRSLRLHPPSRTRWPRAFEVRNLRRRIRRPQSSRRQAGLEGLVAQRVHMLQALVCQGLKSSQLESLLLRARKRHNRTVLGKFEAVCGTPPVPGPCHMTLCCLRAKFWACYKGEP